MGKGKAIFKNSELQREMILFFLNKGYLKPHSLSSYMSKSYSEVYRQHNNLIEQGIIRVQNNKVEVNTLFLKKLCIDELLKQIEEYKRKTKYYKDILEKLHNTKK